MASLTARLEAARRTLVRFPPLTPAVGGLALVVIALAAQSYASYIRWLELDKRGRWRAELPVDFGAGNLCQTSFRPVVSRTHVVKLTLRAPLEGDLAEYAGEEQSLPEKASRPFLAARRFALSWQITHERDAVAHGRIRSSDLGMWAMRDHILCQHTVGLPELQAGQEYTLIAQVEQANPAVNELSPLLQIHTWGSLKGCRLSDWKAVHTLVFCGIGSAFLFMAYVRQIYDRRRTGAPAPSGRSESAAAGRPDWP